MHNACGPMKETSSVGRPPTNGPCFQRGDFLKNILLEGSRNPSMGRLCVSDKTMALNRGVNNKVIYCTGLINKRCNYNVGYLAVLFQLTKLCYAKSGKSNIMHGEMGRKWAERTEENHKGSLTLKL